MGIPRLIGGGWFFYCFYRRMENLNINPFESSDFGVFWNSFWLGSQYLHR
jgi:hypothetical protein